MQYYNFLVYLIKFFFTELFIDTFYMKCCLYAQNKEQFYILRIQLMVDRLVGFFPIGTTISSYQKRIHNLHFINHMKISIRKRHQGHLNF